MERVNAQNNIYRIIKMGNIPKHNFVNHIRHIYRT